MAKAFAFIANNTPQTIVGGGPIAPGTAQAGFGCACGGRAITVSNNAINIVNDCNPCRGVGYYGVDVGATVTASAAGNVTLALYQDGQLVAESTETIAAANDPASIAFPAGVKVNTSSALTLVVTATAGDPIVNNVYTKILRA